MKKITDDIERRAFSHDMRDGLTEIALSSIFLLLAFSLKNPAFSWLYILPVLILGPGLKQFRARHVYPRIGYVEPRGEDARTLFTGMAFYLLATLTVAGLVIFLVRGELSTGAVRRLSPLIAAVLFGGGLRYAAVKSGLRRYTVLFVVALVIGAGLVVFPIEGRYLSLQVFFVAIATVTLVTGLVSFRFFLRTFPIRDVEERSDG